MRTISGVASTRATARRRIARAQDADDWMPGVRSVRARLLIESPLGLLAVCLTSLLVLASALLPVRIAPFQFALNSLELQVADQPTAAARIGEIVFTPFDGNACRKVLFYNQTGAFGPDQHVRCYAETSGERDLVARAGATRTSLIKQAFTFPGAR